MISDHYILLHPVITLDDVNMQLPEKAFRFAQHRIRLIEKCTDQLPLARH